jgi:hypothetical protein
VADRFVGNRIINSPYPATRLLLRIHRMGAERLYRLVTAVQATAAYPSKLLQAGGTQAAGNGAPEPAVASIGPQYGAAGRFRSPGTTGIRWSALLAWVLDTAPRVAGHKGKRRA